MTQQKPAWLVVNADDLGVSRGTTLGIIKAHREGIVTSASLAVTTPHYRFAVESARQCPDLGIGLHLTLTSGRPAAERAHVPQLVNDAGYFKWRFLSLLNTHPTRVPGIHKQIGLEVEAQFARLADDGIRPDHVNGERHVHLIPGIVEIVVAAARRHDVSYIRAGNDIGPNMLRLRDALSLAWNSGFLKWAMLTSLTAKAQRHMEGLASADRIASYLYTGRTGTFLPMLLAAEPTPGVTELMVHPAIPGEDRGLDLGNAELERYVSSDDRLAELDACMAARGNTGAWQLTNFRQLAARGVA